MIVMTQRDYDLIQTIDTLRILSATQIEQLFYSSQQAQSYRCKKLVDHKKLKRFRKDNWSPYLYYLGKKPKQVQSMLAISGKGGDVDVGFGQRAADGGELPRLVLEKNADLVDGHGFHLTCCGCR